MEKNTPLNRLDFQFIYVIRFTQNNVFNTKLIDTRRIGKNGKEHTIKQVRFSIYICDSTYTKQCIRHKLIDTRWIGKNGKEHTIKQVRFSIYTCDLIYTIQCFQHKIN